MATKGYTYFVQMDEDGPIKIGKSSDPWGRLDALQTSVPQKLHMRLLIEGAENEKPFHARFSHIRIRGEWFRPTPEILDFIRASSAAAGDSALVGRTRGEQPWDRRGTQVAPVVSMPRPKKPKPVRAANPKKTATYWDFSGKTFEQTFRELRTLDRLTFGLFGGTLPDGEKTAALARELCGKGPSSEHPIGGQETSCGGDLSLKTG